MKKPLAEVIRDATPYELRPTLCLVDNAPSEWRLLTGRWGDEAVATVGPEGYPQVEADAALLAHWHKHGPKLLERLSAFFYSLEESQSTSDTLAALDACLPDLRAEVDAASEVEVWK